MGTDGVTDAEAEVERLRALVGPEEKDYATLRRDLDSALAAARKAEADLGVVRGELVEQRFRMDRLGQHFVAPAPSWPSRARSIIGRLIAPIRNR